MSIFVNVVGQKMHASSVVESIVEGSQNFVKFKFNLSEEWNGLEIFAQFAQNGKAYNQYLDDDNSVCLPPEIVAGACTMMLYGSHNITIGTTNYLTFKIDENILVSGDVSTTDIPKSLYTQLIEQFDEKYVKSDNVGDAVKSVLDGSAIGGSAEWTEDEKLFIRNMLGAIDEEGVRAIHNENSVLCTPQELTEEQKEQARKNLGVTDDTGIGKKTDGGGEIFNDYENNTAPAKFAHAEGSKTNATGLYSHAEGYNTTASGARAHAEGRDTHAGNTDAHAEGNASKATGFASHAEGFGNTAEGEASHVEGNQNTAGAGAAHVEGQGNKVTGHAAHAEGRVTEARGHSSHVEGKGTFASGAQQHVGGTYNIIDYEGADGEPLELAADGRPAHQYGNDEYKERKSKYLRIEGNGTSDADRSNAETLDWKGNHWLAGKSTAKDYQLDGKTGPLSSMSGIASAVGSMQGTVGAMQNNLGNNIMVITPKEAGSLVLQENTYYQFVGSSTKKKLKFYDSNNEVVDTKEYQVFTIHCGSMTDNAQFGIIEDKTPAYMYVIGNDTGLSALSGAYTGCHQFKKLLPNSTEANPTFRAEVEYPAGSTIIIQTRSSHPL